MTEKRYGKKVDDVDSTIINITEDGNDFAWFLSDDYTDEQVDKVVQRLNKLTVENEQLKTVNTHLKNELSWIRDYAYWKEKDAFNKLWGAYMETCEEYRILVKENEQLRKSNKFLSDMGDVIDIVDENKQLKQFLKELTRKGTGRIDLASGYSYNVSAVLTGYRGDVE